MTNYKWGENEIRNRLDTLVELYNSIDDKTRKETIEEDIEFLQDWLYNCSVTENSENRSIQYNELVEIYLDLKKQFKAISFLWSEFQIFSGFARYPYHIPTIPKNSLTENDILTLTHDFYRSINPFFYEHFMKRFKERDTYLNFGIYNRRLHHGEAISLPSTNEVFINVNREFTLEDFGTTVHEYSHAISFTINPSHQTLGKQHFTEIDSIFFELLAYDYFYDLTKNQTAVLLKAQEHNHNITYANKFNTMMYLEILETELNRDFRNTEEMQKLATQRFRISPDYLEKTLKYGNEHPEIYLTGYMIAIELYMLYKKDKDKALYILRQIIEMRAINAEEYYNNIIKLGIIPNLSIPMYVSNLTNDINRLTRKKPN